MCGLIRSAELHAADVVVMCSDEAMTTTTMQAKALYANSADTEEELSFVAGDMLTVHERDVAGLVGWWLCSHAGRIGIAPGNRLRLLSPTDDAAVASACSGDVERTTADIARHDDCSSTSTKPRPATAPQRGHTAQKIDSSNNGVSVGDDVEDANLRVVAHYQCSWPVDTVSTPISTGRVRRRRRFLTPVNTFHQDGRFYG